MTSVKALTVYDGDLIVGGDFDYAGQASASNIASWDSSSWSALGDGCNCPVYSLCPTSGDLYVGGSFTQAGGGSAYGIAKWADSTWNALGSGLTTYAGYAVCLAIAEYDGYLYAGGTFEAAGGEDDTAYIARWDGAWSSLGTGNDFDDWTFALYVWEDWNEDEFLIAGGEVEETHGSVELGGIGNWNGTDWDDFDGGMDDGIGHVMAVVEYNGDLIAGGGFSKAGQTSASNIARWHQ